MNNFIINSKVHRQVLKAVQTPDGNDNFGYRFINEAENTGTKITKANLTAEEISINKRMIAKLEALALLTPLTSDESI